MTPAEKMAQRLDSCSILDGALNEVPADDVVAMLRRFAAALTEVEALMSSGHWVVYRQRHADALRDVREEG